MIALAERASSEALVRFAGVNKSYDGASYVVQNLNFEVHRGEFLSLLGPSGSGKTTTLMMLAGFERPSSGKILLDGKPLDNVPPWRRGIGIVFQSYALFPHMSVLDNIAFPLRQRKRPEREITDKVRAMLALVKLEELGERYPAQLSGGQQQRVALARALVFDPALVLMDEPLGALDKRLREHMQIELKRIHQKVGVTIVYVTHDQGEALAMSDRVAVFSNGRIRQIATPVELYEQPVDALVADFVGENNRLNGRVEEAGSDACRVSFDDGLLAKAIPMSPVARGDAAILAIRPERIAVGEECCPDNRYPALVAGAAYLGDHARLELSLLSGATLTAKIPNDARRKVPALGDKVTISWRMEDCHVFRAGEVVDEHHGRA